VLPLYVPAAQAEQDVEPGVPWKLPAGHAWHVGLPVAEENFPASQSTHAVCPAFDVFPMAQGVHELDPAAEIKPSGQVEQALAPATLNVPAAQLVQEVWPVALL